MVLTLADHFKFPHELEIPKERLLAQLANVRLLPLRIFTSLGVHVPDDELLVLGTGYELTGEWHKRDGAYTVLVA